jgi:hypothetical protein
MTSLNDIDIYVQEARSLLEPFESATTACVCDEPKGPFDMFIFRRWYSSTRKTVVVWPLQHALDGVVFAIHLNQLEWVKSQRVINCAKEHITPSSMRMWTDWTPFCLLEEKSNISYERGMHLWKLFQTMIDDLAEHCCKYDYICD